MRDKQTEVTVVKPETDVTFNIITNKVERFVSITATRRRPSFEETARADWTDTLSRGGLTIHVIGRGDRLTKATLQAYARAYLDGKSTMWKSVNLANITASEGDVITSLEDDPLWRRIKAISEGGGL